MLNHPVIQLQPLPPRWMRAPGPGPPAVGYFEVSSAIEKATMSTKKHSTGHPIEAAIGPPFCQAKEKVVNVPARTERTRERDREVREPRPGARKLLPIAELREPLLVAASGLMGKATDVVSAALLILPVARSGRQGPVARPYLHRDHKAARGRVSTKRPRLR